MTKDLRAAVIGVGFIGRVHVESLRRIGVEVTAVAASTMDRAQDHAGTHQVPRAYGDYRALLERETIDAVHICTPPALHVAMARDALDAGLHVVCEKPLTVDPDESALLAAQAERLGRIAAVNYNIRYYAAAQRARQLVQEGALGTIHLVHGAYLQDFHVPETPWGWRFEPSFGGPMRAITEIGSHWLDLMRFVTGREVLSVVSDTRTCYPTRRRPDDETVNVISEDYAGALFALEEGAAGTLTVSEVSPGRKNQLRIEIVGTDGTLAWDSEHVQHLWVGRKDEPNQSVVAGFPDGFDATFDRLHHEVYRTISGDPPPSTSFATFADAHEIVRVCDAMSRSSRERRWIDLRNT